MTSPAGFGAARRWLGIGCAPLHPSVRPSVRSAALARGRGWPSGSPGLRTRRFPGRPGSTFGSSFGAGQGPGPHRAHLFAVIPRRAAAEPSGAVTGVGLRACARKPGSLGPPHVSSSRPHLCAVTAAVSAPLSETYFVMSLRPLSPEDPRPWGSQAPGHRGRWAELLPGGSSHPVPRAGWPRGPLLSGSGEALRLRAPPHTAQRAT